MTLVVYLVTFTLITIAFGMGLGLRAEDFMRLALLPRGVIVGLLGQLFLLPTVAILLALFTESPVVAAGLLLMGVCPGGSSSNYMSYLARGDVALSITLTACTGLLAVVYVPFAFNLAAETILDTRVTVSLPVLDTMRRILLYLIVPVVAGMLINHRWPSLASFWGGKVATGAFVVLLLQTPLLILEYVAELRLIVIPSLGWVSLLFVILIPSGYLLGQMTRLPEAQTRSITVEIGVQNVALAIVLAITFFEDKSYVAVPVAYLILMYVFVPLFIARCRIHDARTARPRIESSAPLRRGLRSVRGDTLWR